MIVLLLSLAGAADLHLELAPELGIVPTRTESQDRFGDGNTMPVFGGRVGLALTDALTVQLAAHHGQRGATWFSGEQTIGAAAFYATDLALGLEALVPVNEFFAIGGEASGTGQFALARFDDDSRDPGSAVQKSATGIAPGFRVAPALKITVPDSALPIPLQLRFSAGSQWSGPIELDPFGTTNLRGMSLRLSVGVQL
jgi:hypothetical protein